MRRRVDLHPGTGKTDVRDAYVTADAARTLPHTLRRVTPATRPWPSWVCWSASTTIWPARPAGRPTASAACSPTSTPPWSGYWGRRPPTPRYWSCSRAAAARPAWPRPGAASSSRSRSSTPPHGRNLVTAIYAALHEHSVTVPGTAAAETVLPRLADSLRGALRQRDQVAAEVERILDAHPLAEVLISMPGVGIRTAARILLDVGDASVVGRHQRGRVETRPCNVDEPVPGDGLVLWVAGYGQLCLRPPSLLRPRPVGSSPTRLPAMLWPLYLGRTCRGAPARCGRPGW